MRTIQRLAHRSTSVTKRTHSDALRLALENKLVSEAFWAAACLQAFEDDEQGNPMVETGDNSQWTERTERQPSAHSGFSADSCLHFFPACGTRRPSAN